MQTKVSIIIPCIASENIIANAVDSILCQTYENFELLLIENSSLSANNIAINELSFKDSRIKVIECTGQSLALMLNTGIEATKAPYIALMDAQDISLPERIYKQVKYLSENTDVGIVSTLVKRKSEPSESEENEIISTYLNWSNRIITHEDISVNRFIEMPVIFSTVMFRKDLADKLGAFINSDCPADHELCMRWLANGIKMYKIPETLVLWDASTERFNSLSERYSDQGLFETKSRYAIDWLKKNNEFYPEVVVWGASHTARQRFYILHELGAHAKFYIDINPNPVRKVIQFQHTPPAGQNFILCYISNALTREKVRIFLVELGYIEGKDFLCMA